MKDYVPLVSIVVSGLFGAFIAWLSARLAQRHMDTRAELDHRRKLLAEVSELYTDLLASMNKLFVVTIARDSDIVHGFESVHPRVELLAPKPVVEATNRWYAVFEEWQANYLEGQGDKAGENLRIIGQHTFRALERSKELYPELHKAGLEVIDACRTHIEGVRRGT